MKECPKNIRYEVRISNYDIEDVKVFHFKEIAVKCFNDFKKSHPYHNVTFYEIRLVTYPRLPKN